MTSEQGCGIGHEYPHSHLIQLSLIFLFITSWIIDGLFLYLAINFGFLIFDIIRVILFTFTFILAYRLIKLSGFIVSDEVIQKGQLITKGIFAYVRNPMYLGVIMIYLAFLFLTMSLICLISLILIIIIYDIMVSYEEKELENVFGKEFLDYKKKVPKWLPKLRIRE